METPTKGFKWDSESERDLFGACLVVLGEPKGQTLAQARELLQDTRGVPYTLKAAQHRIQHLQKLKRKDGAPGSENTTPAKKPAAGKKRGKTADDDDEAGAAAVQEPTKKKRTAPKKSAKTVKAEAEEPEDIVKNEQLEEEDADMDAV